MKSSKLLLLQLQKSLLKVRLQVLIKQEVVFQNSKMQLKLMKFLRLQKMFLFHRLDLDILLQWLTNIKLFYLVELLAILESIRWQEKHLFLICSWKHGQRLIVGFILNYILIIWYSKRCTSISKSCPCINKRWINADGCIWRCNRRRQSCKWWSLSSRYEKWGGLSIMDDCTCC